MESILTIAQYVYNKYLEKENYKIDEMKLHKILYFIQRENFVQKNCCLFEEDFQGWKYGPVCIEVREKYNQYKKKKFAIFIDDYSEEKINKETLNLINTVFDKYYKKNSWNLSRITHFEYSWNRSRINIKDDENGNVIILKDDIKKDAERIKKRREYLNSDKNKEKYNYNTIPSIDEDLFDEMEQSNINIDSNDINIKLKRILKTIQ